MYMRANIVKMRTIQSALLMLFCRINNPDRITLLRVRRPFYNCQTAVLSGGQTSDWSKNNVAGLQFFFFKFIVNFHAVFQ